MDERFENSEWALAAFYQKVWPLICQKQEILDTIGGDLFSNELPDRNETAGFLDVRAGIDFIVVPKTGTLRGVAQRVQKASIKYPPYNTFTLAHESAEHSYSAYETMLDAIERGGMFPEYSIQSYIAEDGRIRTVGVAKTCDIVYAIKNWLAMGGEESGEKGVQLVPDNQGGKFFKVRWSYLDDKMIYRYMHPIEYSLMKTYANTNGTPSHSEP